MKICPKCQTKFESEQNFCSNCGEKLMEEVCRNTENVNTDVREEKAAAQTPFDRFRNEWGAAVLGFLGFLMAFSRSARLISPVVFVIALFLGVKAVKTKPMASTIISLVLACVCLFFAVNIAFVRLLF